MAKTFEVELKGADELRRLLERVGDRAPQALKGPLFRFAHQEIALPAKQKYVPVVTGALKNSIIVDTIAVTPTGVEIVVGAGGPSASYALAVHENPRAGKTTGLSPSGKKYRHWSRVGGWKFLELPAKEAAGRPERLIQDVRKEVEALLGRSR